MWILVCLWQSAQASLGKYSLILDKELLGRKPRAVPTPRPTPPPVQTTPSWASSYQMTMMTLNQRTGKARVGLQNIREDESLLLIQGSDNYPAFELLEVDMEKQTAQVRHQDATHTFRLQEGPAPAPSKPEPEERPSQIRRIRPTPIRTNDSAQTESETSAPVTTRFKTREELETHLQQVQMDAIRT